MGREEVSRAHDLRGVEDRNAYLAGLIWPEMERDYCFPADYPCGLSFEEAFMTEHGLVNARIELTAYLSWPWVLVTEAEFRRDDDDVPVEMEGFSKRDLEDDLGMRLYELDREMESIYVDDLKQFGRYPAI